MLDQAPTKRAHRSHRVPCREKDGCDDLHLADKTRPISRTSGPAGRYSGAAARSIHDHDRLERAPEDVLVVLGSTVGDAFVDI